MKKAGNPFVFGAANDFSPDEVLEYYIEDFNYSRFLNSTRNVFILGERGSGKTMTLLYHKLATQRRKAEQEGEQCSLDYIGVYIPCNTPLMHRHGARTPQCLQGGGFVRALPCAGNRPLAGQDPR